MKRILSIIVLLAFIIVNYSKVFIVVHYELNKKQLTEQFCINKDKPQMHCCAKCLLKKKLAEDDAKKNSPALPDVKNDIQLFGSPLSVQINNSVNEGINMQSSYSQILLPGVQSSVFHPPCA
ncbi:MAG: hypothetical protein ACLQQ4_04850 [Bacteroidia bacterium]